MVQFGTNNDDDTDESFSPSIRPYFLNIDNNIKFIDIHCQPRTPLFIDDKCNGYMCGWNSHGM